MPRSVKEESVSQYVGNFLRMELLRRGMTQEAFAEEVGVADRTVRRWVSGEIHSLEGVQEIAWALNISIRDIFSEWDDVPSHFYQVFVPLKRTKSVLSKQSVQEYLYMYIFRNTMCVYMEESDENYYHAIFYKA